jgi:hypothetical protein
MHLSETLVILILLIPFILLLIAIIDLVKKEYSKATDKIVWILIVVLIPVLGPLLYFFVGRRSGSGTDKRVSGY